eukprot:CAMPEP_0203684940 /NCGR_PEP_ID=MMETSP0090-20130426/48292_1 /ASSEMBLY_ACC=CAM_ASM_001088 /TAXON_ID=426623 /ORGANISM="Chaetoceros affinis, Strain CCMP159" /LENGTH=205 /DNA_ID=CAMNT_0050554123 /DNA_START=1947 /DNA_END=2567 /DNA_ORIENTATION=-
MRKQIATPRCMQYRKSGVGAQAWQWSGWRMAIPNHLWMKVSCWVKFVSVNDADAGGDDDDDDDDDDKQTQKQAYIPPPSGNFGLKLHGRLDNSWVKDCRPNTWTHISSVARATGGDGNHILLIFDSIREKVVVRFADLRLQIIDSPEKAKTKTPPINEYVAFTNSGMSKDYVAMGIDRKGIPAASGYGSMAFVSDYPPQNASKKH